jgi:hypothetical protein
VSHRMPHEDGCRSFRHGVRICAEGKNRESVIESCKSFLWTEKPIMRVLSNGGENQQALFQSMFSLLEPL